MIHWVQNVVLGCTTSAKGTPNNEYKKNIYTYKKIGDHQSRVLALLCWQIDSGKKVKKKK